MRKWIVILFLLPLFAYAQTNTTIIPGKLKVKIIPHAPALRDSMLTVDTLGNIKKDTIPSGGGGSANGVNGLNGTGNIGLGGTLSQATSIATGGFNFTINNATAGGTAIQRWQSFGSTVSFMDVAGSLNTKGISMLSSPLNGRLDMSGNNPTILRNVANSGTAFTVAQLNTGSTGHIVDFSNSSYASFSLGIDGEIFHTPIAKAVTGAAIAYNMAGALKPTANGDVLIGMEIHPAFGISTISGIGTLAGGSGYPNGTQLSNVTGGTGKQAVIQCTVSGGIVTGVSIIDGGVNYTVGDVLTIVIVDANGNPTGSGGHITVTSNTSYTGTTNYAIRTWGVDEYGTDLSSQFDANSKVSKFYVDNKVISGAFTGTGSATTTFTVTIGVTMPTNSYNVQITAANALTTTVVPYVNNRTLTTFDVVYPAGLTGTVQFFYLVTK